VPPKVPVELGDIQTGPCAMLQAGRSSPTKNTRLERSQQKNTSFKRKLQKMQVFWNPFTPEIKHAKAGERNVYPLRS